MRSLITSNPKLTNGGLMRWRVSMTTRWSSTGSGSTWTNPPISSTGTGTVALTTARTKFPLSSHVSLKLLNISIKCFFLLNIVFWLLYLSYIYFIICPEDNSYKVFPFFPSRFVFIKWHTILEWNVLFSLSQYQMSNVNLL